MSTTIAPPANTAEHSYQSLLEKFAQAVENLKDLRSGAWTPDEEEWIDVMGSFYNELTLASGIHVTKETNLLSPPFLMSHADTSQSDPDCRTETVAKATKAVLFRVTYVDAVVRETYVKAHNESEAEERAENEFDEGVHHHAIDAYRDDMQALPAINQAAQFCFECGH